MIDLDVVFVDALSNRKISNVDVFGALGRWSCVFHHLDRGHWKII
jgi:hypothetical protein